MLSKKTYPIFLKKENYDTRLKKKKPCACDEASVCVYIRVINKNYCYYFLVW